MKPARNYFLGSLVTGALVVAPVYLATLLLLKGIASASGIVRPVAVLLPDWMPAEGLVAFLAVLVVCLLVGMGVKTAAGNAVRQQVERSLFARMPGYSLLRGLTQRIAGEGIEDAWKPALIEIEDALVPGFIIEDLPDGRFTVFVPSVPTPLAGAVYIIDAARVHAVDVPFTQAIKVVSRWGQGAAGLVAAMERPRAGSLAAKG